MLSLQYLAGLFDGEGCITWSRGLCVSITNTHLPLLRLIREQRGGSVTKKSDRPGAVNHLQAWEWRAWGDRAQRLLEDIEPHLIVKSEQSVAARAARGSKNRYHRELWVARLSRLKKTEYPA